MILKITRFAFKAGYASALSRSGKSSIFDRFRSCLLRVLCRSVCAAAKSLSPSFSTTSFHLQVKHELEKKMNGADETRAKWALAQRAKEVGASFFQYLMECGLFECGLRIWSKARGAHSRASRAAAVRRPSSRLRRLRSSKPCPNAPGKLAPPYRYLIDCGLFECGLRRDILTPEDRQAQSSSPYCLPRSK